MSCSFQSSSFVLYRFIQIYFIYVDAIVHGIFLISLSDYSLQVYINTIDFSTFSFQVVCQPLWWLKQQGFFNFSFLRIYLFFIFIYWVLVVAHQHLHCIPWGTRTV